MNYKKILLTFIFFLFARQTHTMHNQITQTLAKKFIQYCDIVIEQNKKFTKNTIAQTDLRSSPPTFDIDTYHQNKINKFEEAKNNIIAVLNNTQDPLLASIKQVITINYGDIITMLEINDIVLTSEEKQLIKTL